jgi:DNA polymerase-1
VAAKLIDENHKDYRLGSLVKREYGFTYDKIGSKGVDNYPFSEAALYSYLDAQYTWLLWNKYCAEIERQGLERLHELEMQMLPVVIDMELTGTPIDKQVLAELGEEFSMEMARHQLAIDRKAGKPVNLNAGRQVAEFIYDILGHKCTVFTTKTNERSTAAATLESFGNDPYVERIQEYAKLGKLQGTFIDGISRNLNNGRVHASFNQMGTVSGRLSCSTPNLQQIPSRSDRGKRVRDVFVASPGNVLIVSDLSQIELRVLAHFTQDNRLLRSYRDNIDLHSALATRVFGPDFTPAQRSLAKNAHFSVLYGAGAGTMVRMYKVPSLQLAQQVLKGFYESYPRVAPWKKRVWAEARGRAKRGQAPYVETLLGRRRRLPALNWSDDDLRSAAERQAVSVTISGSAADLFKVVMINVDDALRQQGWKGHILMTVHDELVVEVPEEFADEGLELVRYWMENVNNPWTDEPMLSVPIVADAKIVTRWSDAK